MVGLIWLPGDTVAEWLMGIVAGGAALGAIWRWIIRKVVAWFKWIKKAIDKIEMQTNGVIAEQFTAILDELSELRKQEQTTHDMIVGVNARLTVIEHVEKGRHS